MSDLSYDGKYHNSDHAIILGMIEHLKKIIRNTTDQAARDEAIAAIELTGPQP